MPSAPAAAATLLLQIFLQVPRADFGPEDIPFLVDADAFEPITRIARPCYAVLAVFLGKTRLIDNLYVEPVGDSEELAYHL